MHALGIWSTIKYRDSLVHTVHHVVRSTLLAPWEGIVLHEPEHVYMCPVVIHVVLSTRHLRVLRVELADVMQDHGSVDHKGHHAMAAFLLPDTNPPPRLPHPKDLLHKHPGA